MIDRALRIRPAALLALPATLLMLAAAAPVAHAELVVFEHGRVLKVSSHRDAGDRIEIRFPGGGSLTFDRALVERIEPDEVAESEAQAPPAQPPPQPPARMEAPRPVVREPAATQTEAQVGEAPKAPEELRPAPPAARRGRRHRH